MPLFTVLKSLITYKEPKNIEGFEFLEDKNEIPENSNSSSHNNKENKSSSKKRQMSYKKVPLKVGGWNDKKEKKDKQTEAEAKKEASDDKNITLCLNINKEKFRKEFNMPLNLDAVIREFKIAKKYDAFILYMEGMVDTNNINNFILRQLMSADSFTELGEDSLIDYIMYKTLTINRVFK